MLPAALPYGLAPPAFPFRALAALAGRATLGETRETALACLLGARLLVATLPPYRLSEEQRRQRAAAAATWLTSLTLPAEVRPAVATLYELAADAPPPVLAEGLAAVLAAAGAALDDRAAAEISGLALRLREAAARPAAQPQS